VFFCFKILSDRGSSEVDKKFSFVKTEFEIHVVSPVARVSLRSGL
jgi:hypothetical protein